MRVLAKRPLLLAAVGMSILLVDQVSKLLIIELVMQPPRDIPLLPFLNVTLGFNRGVSFGLFADQLGEMPGVLGMFKIAVVITILVWASTVKSLFQAIALGAIAGGAVGNIIDRLRDGAVTDFIDVSVESWHWPAFNIADVAIVLGTAAIILHSIRPVGESERFRNQQ
ncbi:signal peptidase II [Ensifer sp. P24N7]|uniref:signal peptidase II n=1 Tax=Sinorhizobium sp. P24N7 TaxID=3348358 RepID=UPI0035F3AEFC